MDDQKIFRDLLDRVSEQVATKRAELMETFIVGYLKLTGARIEDTALYEEMTPDGKIKFWLGPKN